MEALLALVKLCKSRKGMLLCCGLVEKCRKVARCCVLILGGDVLRMKCSISLIVLLKGQESRVSAMPHVSVFLLQRSHWSRFHCEEEITPMLSEGVWPTLK